MHDNKSRHKYTTTRHTKIRNILRTLCTANPKATETDKAKPELNPQNHRCAKRSSRENLPPKIHAATGRYGHSRLELSQQTRKTETPCHTAQGTPRLQQGFWATLYSLFVSLACSANFLSVLFFGLKSIDRRCTSGNPCLIESQRSKKK